MSTHQSLLLVVRFTSDTTAEGLATYSRLGLPVDGPFFIFGTTAIFIRLVSLFIAYVASSLEALVLTFLVLAFVPWGSLFLIQPFRSRRVLL